MKKSILFFIMLLAVALTGCKNYDEDIDKINARLAALETWEANVNINITALQTAVTALQGKDYVTKVVALSDGSGYQITFQNSGTITLKNGTDGKDGVTPIIGAAVYTDGYYYWTVNTGSGVTWLKNADGKMIRTTGDTPKMKIGDDGYWYVAADGVNFVSTGVKAQGDAVFADYGVAVGNTSVTFTLADGTTFAVPLYQALKIAEDITDDIINVVNDTTTFSVTLPAGLKKSDFTSLLATIECNSGTSTDLKTRSGATANTWGVEMVMCTFQGDTLCNNDAKVNVYIPYSMTSDNMYSLLTVKLAMKDGSILTASRTLAMDKYNLQHVEIGDVVYSDGTCSSATEFATYGKSHTAVGICFFARQRVYDNENDNVLVSDNTDPSVIGYRDVTRGQFLGYMVSLVNAADTAKWEAAKTAVQAFDKKVDINYISDGWFLPSMPLITKLFEARGPVGEALKLLGATNLEHEYWSSTRYDNAYSWISNLALRNGVGITSIQNGLVARPVAIFCSHLSSPVI
jgi:hypothetical protein